MQRIAQERSSNIHAADVVECSDMTALFAWKKEGWLASYVPADVAKYPADYRDPDGFYATDRLTLSPIEYNTKLVKPEDAPKSFADLLDPKWKGKIVKAHPGYSGTIMTVTYEISRDLGWDYLKKLGQQQIMQVQSAADPPKKVVQGERPIAADGGEYLPLQMIEKARRSALSIRRKARRQSRGVPVSSSTRRIRMPRACSPITCSQRTDSNCWSIWRGCARRIPT